MNKPEFGNIKQLQQSKIMQPLTKIQSMFLMLLILMFQKFQINSSKASHQASLYFVTHQVALIINKKNLGLLNFGQEKLLKEILIYNTLAMTLDYAGKYQDAIENYKKFVQINPEYRFAYYNSAISYKKLSKIDETVKMYQKSVQIYPKYSWAYKNLENIYKDRQQYEQAIDCFENAIKYNSYYTLALTNLAVCYLKKDRFKEAGICLKFYQNYIVILNTKYSNSPSQKQDN